MSLGLIERAEAFSFTIKWKIDRICSKMKVGHFLESPKFTLNKDNNVIWCLRLYPRGREFAYKDYVSLYLYANAEIKASADLRIINNQGEKVRNYTIT